MKRLQWNNHLALAAALGLMSMIAAAGCSHNDVVTTSAVPAGQTPANSMPVSAAGLNGLKQWLKSQPDMPDGEKQDILKRAEAQEARTSGQVATPPGQAPAAQ
jgi:hypothetical protein